jgi:hypothetical protein
MNIENVPKTYIEMRDWADDYEKSAMFPSETNHQLADLTTNLLLYYTPTLIKPFAKKLIIGLMDDRLRNAMIYSPQGPFIHNFINGFFKLRGFLIRNFYLPRISRITFTEEEKNKYGRYNVKYADNEVFVTRKKRGS